jgi:hypothetical protein
MSQIEAWSSTIYAWYQEFEFEFFLNFFLNFKQKLTVGPIGQKALNKVVSHTDTTLTLPDATRRYKTLPDITRHWKILYQ